MAGKAKSQNGADVKNEFVPFSEADAQSLAGSGPFGRGKTYFRSGHITEAVLRGDTLYGQCEGSQEEPYALTLTLVRAKSEPENAAPEPQTGHKRAAPPYPPTLPGIAAYECDCEAGGFCKHLVAFALAWINAPVNFDVRPTFDALLQDHSREQLLALCLKLLARQPELEYLIDTVVPVVPVTAPALDSSAADAPATPAVSPLANTLTADPNALRRRAQKVFRSYENDYDDYDDYGHSAEIAADLEPLVQAGDDYAEAGQWANAQAAYEVVALEIIGDYDEAGPDSELSAVAADCCDGLARCLDAQPALPESARLGTKMRHQLIETLYKVWEYDQTMGGSMAEGVPQAIARNVTDAERALVETWLLAGMQEGTGFSTQYRKRARVNFLVELKAQSGISDEEKLEEYRRFGLYEEMTKLLLQMGRIEDAIQLALEQTATAPQLTEFANHLLALGGDHVAQAFQLIEQQLAAADSAGREQNTAHYLPWLGAAYAQHDRPQQALAARRRVFDSSPSRFAYEKVREAAKLAGLPAETWAQTRPGLIAALEAGKSWSDLVTLYVEEGDARGALDALVEYDQQTTHWHGGSLHADVAKVAEAEYPDEARVIYQLLAENLIEARGRGNYQTAATYLARAKDLYTRLNRVPQWNTYMANLRERNKRLTALHDELRTLKLL